MATKMDLLATVKESFDKDGIKLNKKEISVVLDTVLAKVEELAINNGSVTVYPYKFKKKVRGARKGLNPKTGETLMIPEKTVIKFIKFEKKDEPMTMAA
jgi:nucleoid DNA-binding protein